MKQKLRLISSISLSVLIVILTASNFNTLAADQTKEPHIISNHLELHDIAEVATHSDEGSGKVFPQFDFSKYSEQIFWLIITFSLTYMLLHYRVVPAITKIKLARSHKIRNNVEKSIKITNDIEEIEKTIDDLRNKTKEEINSIMLNVSNRLAEITKQKSEELENYKTSAMKSYKEKIDSYGKEEEVKIKDNIINLETFLLQKLNFSSNKT